MFHSDTFRQRNVWLSHSFLIHPIFISGNISALIRNFQLEIYSIADNKANRVSKLAFYFMNLDHVEIPAMLMK